MSNAVNAATKPAELLRVWRRYGGRNNLDVAEGFGEQRARDTSRTKLHSCDEGPSQGPAGRRIAASLRRSTSASQACGSTSLSLAVSISVNIAAAPSPPRSEPAKSQTLRPSAIPRSARSECHRDPAASFEDELPYGER